MSYVSLYNGNTRYNFLIGSATPGGKYGFSVSLWVVGDMTAPSGTVNGVTIPSISGTWCNYNFNENPVTINAWGTDINAALGAVIGASSSKTFYTKPGNQGSSFTFETDADKDIRVIYMSSGSYHMGLTRTVKNPGTFNISFMFCDGFGFSQYDNLCIGINNDAYGVFFGGGLMLNYVFTNSTANSLQDRFDSGSLINASPGDEGFVPIGDPTKYVIGGGDISGVVPMYPTDTLTQPDAPDESGASAVNSGFLNIYHINEANLARLGTCLYDGLLAKLNNIFMSPMDSIVSLQIFPCAPLDGSTEAVKVLKYTCISADLGADSQAARLANQFRQYDFGTLYVPEQWGSFLDYDASAFSLYLPFIGAVDLDVGEVMGGYVNVKYTVDFLTGMCVANVLCTKTYQLSSGQTPPQYAQHSYMGNCSVQVPLNSVSYGNIIGSLANAAAAGLKGGIVGVAASAASSALSGGFKPIIETKGTVNANAGFCAVLQPYITISRPVPAESTSFQTVNGYPSYIESTLGACKDLCICDNINLTGLSGATDSEIERIKQMCKDGVYV